MEGKDVWAWEDGSKWDFESWDNGQPNNSGGDENNVLINWEGPGFWNDISRTSDNSFFPFVCQANEKGT